jgi:ATP-dependent RNA helicase DDX56/DBP9
MADESLVESRITFGSFSHLLDARVLRALADMGFAHPTLIQAKSIPLALENKDILARARTGSGKTAAYCIPLVQKILNTKPAVGGPPPVSCTSQELIADPLSCFKRTQAMTPRLHEA